MGKMSVSIYKKGEYEDFHTLGRRKNKANSKPNKANRRALAEARNPKQNEWVPNERCRQI